MSATRILLVEDSPSDAVLLQESLVETRLAEFDFTHVETLGRRPPHGFNDSHRSMCCCSTCHCRTSRAGKRLCGRGPKRPTCRLWC